MNSQFGKLLLVSLGCFTSGVATCAAQSTPMAPVRDAPSTNAGWQWVPIDSHQEREIADHLPVPPPADMPKKEKAHSNSPTLTPSAGRLISPTDPPQEQGEMEEIEGREVIGQSVSRPPRDRQGSESSDRVEVIRQRYPDGSVQIKRHVMQDAEGNYFNHGMWQLFNPRGQVLAEGNFEKGAMHGPWQRWHPIDSAPMFNSIPFIEFSGPYLSRATFSQGTLDGRWVIYDRYRRKIFEMPYKNGVRHGLASWYRPNGIKLREVTFRENVPHGEMIEWNEQNEVMRRETFVQGQQVSREITYWRPGQKQTEDHFLEAKIELAGQDDWWNAQPAAYETVGQRVRHGLSAAWYDNGQPKMRGQYRQGLRVGQFEWWYRNGQIQLSGRYENGLKTGQWTWWHENGMKAVQGEYQGDVAAGTWKRWDSEGNVIETNQAISESSSGELRPPLFDFEEIEGPANPGNQ